jgi:hypothetical protein
MEHYESYHNSLDLEADLPTATKGTILLCLSGVSVRREGQRYYPTLSLSPHSVLVLVYLKVSGIQATAPPPPKVHVIFFFWLSPRSFRLLSCVLELKH